MPEPFGPMRYRKLPLKTLRPVQPDSFLRWSPHTKFRQYSLHRCYATSPANRLQPKDASASFARVLKKLLPDSGKGLNDGVPYYPL